MKAFKILFLIVILFQFGCEKDDIEKTVGEWSKVTAQLNKQKWETQAIAYYAPPENLSQIDIKANIFDKYGQWRETLSFRNVDLQVGRQTLLKRIYNSEIDTINSAYTTIMADGDVIEDRFAVFEDAENYIEIETIDTLNKKITGTFQVTFVRDINDSVTNPNLPDTMRFTEGEFCLQIDDRK